MSVTTFNAKCIDSTGIKTELTQGRVYEVEDRSVDGWIVVINNDLGHNRLLYRAHRFSQVYDRKPEAVSHPSHYNQGGIECIDAIRASMSLEAFRGFLKGNQLKYLWRYEAKGKAAEDIAKSNQYGAWLAETYTETK